MLVGPRRARERVMTVRESLAHPASASERFRAGPAPLARAARGSMRSKSTFVPERAMHLTCRLAALSLLFAYGLGCSATRAEPARPDKPTVTSTAPKEKTVTDAQYKKPSA